MPRLFAQHALFRCQSAGEFAGREGAIGLVRGGEQPAAGDDAVLVVSALPANPCADYAAPSRPSNPNRPTPPYPRYVAGQNRRGATSK